MPTFFVLACGLNKMYKTFLVLIRNVILFSRDLHPPPVKMLKLDPHLLLCLVQHSRPGRCPCVDGFCLMGFTGLLMPLLAMGELTCLGKSAVADGAPIYTIANVPRSAANLASDGLWADEMWV
ncbi:hypothetical protein Nepgr_007964 [Nepenthes gracilis]|uniref:Uncharacterized protein n=1 Tax=Nepenthes gracilis TaxID=150966 RepID=A0AAD3S828_NEPGR|nr:hypothetical protein Nepgr_007964 [Nepenthes gracilis]